MLSFKFQFYHVCRLSRIGFWFVMRVIKDRFINVLGADAATMPRILRPNVDVVLGVGTSSILALVGLAVMFVNWARR